jgi:NAD(P)H-hydrate repair Nnr-like enzyme with NAD(P)H-hydrate dehydratase domain
VGREVQVMLLVAGIIPIPDLPLIQGYAKIDGSNLQIDGYNIPCNQGTAAMVSAALTVTNYLGTDPPRVVFAGDIGSGVGSRFIYRYLIDNVVRLEPKVLALHYCMPDLKLTVELCNTVERCVKRPVLLADAASMYAAKAASVASRFDIFTPDLSEIAFLADPEAIHPAYINKYLFEADCSKIPELIEKAYQYNGAAKNLLVKGAVDYIVTEGKIIEKVDEPDVPILECIGGTGDTITGMVAAFADADLELHQAAVISAKANRAAGEYADVTPADTVFKLINNFPVVLKNNLCLWSGVCTF